MFTHRRTDYSLSLAVLIRQLFAEASWANSTFISLLISAHSGLILILRQNQVFYLRR